MKSLFSGRALRNIEILLAEISLLPSDLTEAMLLCLTAAVGQMSNMVFAVTARGKTRGESNSKIEVGSWVIGYWCPREHFEVNVWNCFETRVSKLTCGLRKTTAPGLSVTNTAKAVLDGDETAAVVLGDTLAHLPLLPDHSVDLILTDPPHSDRIPYLELSELWNSILGLSVDLDSEIVVSNARERNKTVEDYTPRMTRFMEIAAQKIKVSGSIVILFNARDPVSWDFLNKFTNTANLDRPRYAGCFPLSYSAGSVVQDNREGSLKNDYAIVFSRSPSRACQKLADIEGWQTQLPPHIKE